MSSEPPGWRLLGSTSISMRIGKGSLSARAAPLGAYKASVAIARKLLVAVWHVLSQQCAYIHGWRAGRRPYAAQLSRTFGTIRGQTPLSGHTLVLLRGINWDEGAGLEEIHYNGRVYRLSGAHREGGIRLRAFLLPFLSGLCESTTPLLEVSTEPWRAALLRLTDLDTVQRARFEVGKPDSKAKNGMVFWPLDLLSTSVSTSSGLV